MIDPLVIKRWLEQPLRDSAKAKRFSREALLAKVAKLEPEPDFVLPPFRHQLAMFLLCTQRPGYTLHADMGTGKTKTMIDVYRWRKKSGHAKRMLVLVPGTSHIDEWQRELKIHGPELVVDAFTPNVLAAARESMLFDGDADVLVMTYQGATSMLTKKSGRSWAPDDRKLRRAAKRLDMLVCDESTQIKNSNGVTFRCLRRFVPAVPFRYCLSGTPANMSMLDLWSQFYIADGGETLGKTLGVFRQAFFKEVDGPWAKTYKIKQKLVPKLHRRIRHGAIRFEDKECQDLPAKIGGIDDPRIWRVPMSIAQGRRVAGIRDEMRQAVLDQDTERVENSYYMMRCLSSGYVPTESGFHDYAENPKLEALLDRLREGLNHRWLVFFHYQHSGDLLGEALRKENIEFVEISGRVKNKAKALARFHRGVPVLLGSGAAAMGLNLQACTRTAYFETPDSIAMRKQSEKRTHRHGQTVRVRFYDFEVMGTYDRRILEALRQGKKVLDAVVDGVQLC